MQKSMKRLLSVLAVLALVLTMAPAGILAVETKAALSADVQQKIADAAAIQAKALTLTATSTECPCHPGETVTWLPLPTTQIKPAGGEGHMHYYVEGTFNGSVGNQLQLNSFKATDAFCLLLINNAQVNLTGRFLFYAGAAYTVNIMGSGTVTTTNASASYGLLSLTGTGNASVNLYGGTFRSTGNNTRAKSVIYLSSSNSYASINVYNDVVIGSATAPTSTSAHSANAVIGTSATTGGTLNLYGGTIQNGKATAADNTNGGNVYMYASTRAKFNMYAGEIKNGYTSINGGNIWVGSGATANLYGGTVSGGYGAANGGNIFANGTVYIDDAVITDGESKLGGNINIYSGKLTTTKNAEITNGSGQNDGYATYGGNIYLINAKPSKLEGTITGGYAMNGGNVYVSGSTVAGTPSTVEIAADISDGRGKYGSNVGAITGKPNGASALYQLDLTFSGGTIKNGVLEDVNELGLMAPDAHIFINKPDDAAEGVKVTLKGDFTNEQTLYITKADGKNTLTVDPSWTGSTGFSAGAAYYAGNTVADASATELNGSLKNVYGHNVPIVSDGIGGLKLVDFVVIDEEEKQTGYATAAEALAAADKKSNVRVVTGTDFAMNGEEVVVDAIGDITVTGTGKIFGMDYENNGYKSNNGWITAPEGVVQPKTTINGVQYVALNNAFEEHANAWSFHRVEAALTSVTVNKDNAGMYYKAQYKFDAKVAEQVASYGVLVKLNEAVNAENYANKTTATDAATAYDAETATLTAKSHGVYGIFKTTNEAAVNVANGNTKLFGNPYIMIGDEMFTAAESTGMSLADAMVRANTVWEKMSEEDQANLNAFVSEWKALNAWSEDVLELLDNFTIA